MMNTKKTLLIPILLIVSILSVREVGASPQNIFSPRLDRSHTEKDSGKTTRLVCDSLESTVDDLIEAEMSNAQIPGMAIAIVKDGDILVKKGYGWADISTQAPVSTEESIFQVGSVSKLFTWTAVMQLVEQGKLDLDTDINQYLDEKVQIEPTFDQPVTLAHLMTHTAGFEDRATGIYTQTAGELGDLSEFLAANQPEQVRPPGVLTSYSNYGTTLAAYIVQRVSGQPFEQYIAENIFQPLKMENASFQQPAPVSISGEMVTGYVLANNELIAQPITYTRQIGAGGVTTTAKDMAHFLMAYLDMGHYKDTQILAPSTMAQMMSSKYTHHPQLSGNVSGLWEKEVNQHQVLYHAGDTLSFSSMLALVPSENLGIFITYNRVADGPRHRILEGLLTSCLTKGKISSAGNSSLTSINSMPFSGAYQSIRIDHTTPARLLAFGWESSVQVGDGGQLEIDGKLYKPIGAELFQQVDGPEKVAFRLDERGRSSHLFFDSIPTMAFKKLHWWETSIVQISALVVPLLVFLVSLITWGASTIRKTLPSKSTAHRVSIVMSLLGLTIAGSAGSAMMDAAAIIYGVPLTLKLAVWLSYPFTALAVIISAISLALWFLKIWTPLQRLHYTLVALSGLVFIWFLSYWNILMNFKTMIEWLSN